MVQIQKIKVFALYLRTAIFFIIFFIDQTNSVITVLPLALKV